MSVQTLSARVFLARYVEAFNECSPKVTEDQDCAWKNWTAFMTGKQGKVSGFWDKDKAVLPQTAEKLKLKWQLEYLHLDLVLFPSGDPWGNLVVVEHENEIRGFQNEIEKLMSVLAPLKVGITYDGGNAEKHSELMEWIHRFFRTRHPLILEAPQTEYLFLLGAVNKGVRPWPTWKYLTFTCGDGPEGSTFRDIGCGT